MAITEKSIKLLWSNAAGRCSFRNCPERLTIEQGGRESPYTCGEMAHIKGKRAGANRHDSSQSVLDRDSYNNLILLCPTHHTLIDKKENEHLFTVEQLIEMKVEHESYVSSRIDGIKVESLSDLQSNISILLAENRLAWAQYGPNSDLARRNPLDDAIYSIWLSERLSTIVPNNRSIVKLIEGHRELFGIAAQDLVSAFLVHASSYESWVDGTIPYRAVLRFPVEFEELIKS